MGIIIDVCIIMILALCIFIGYKKGLSGSIFKLISFLLAIVITFIIYKPVTDIVIEKTKINETLKNSIVSKVQNKEEIEEDDEGKGFVESINNKIKDVAEDSKDKVIDETATEMSKKIVTIGVTIILFFIVRLLLLVVAFVISLITEIPIIKQFDKAGGIIYGLLQGIVIIYILFAILSFFDTIGILQSVNKLVDSSYIGSLLKESLKYKILLKY